MTGPRPDPAGEPVQLPPKVTHGGFTAYQRYGCRCEPCQVHMRRTRKRYSLKPRKPCPDDKHGRAGYTYYGCRCDTCCEARGRYDQERWELRKGRKS